jgi:glycerol-3-phosphate cytidylyltransferase
MTVYTQGSFDILHSGHINILKKCRKLAGKDGKVIVAVLGDKAYEKYRKYPPAKLFKDRKALLESIVYVDEVIESDNMRTKQEIRKIRPDLVVVGTDWAAKDIYKQYHMKREELDPILVFSPYTPDVSSTAIKERMKK